MNLRIKELREDNDLTQKEISNILKCAQQTYSRYETKEITIDIFNIVKLAEFYNTSTDYLLGLTDEKKPYPKIQKNKNLNKITQRNRYITLKKK